MLSNPYGQRIRPDTFHLDLINPGMLPNTFRNLFHSDIKELNSLLNISKGTYLSLAAHAVSLHRHPTHGKDSRVLQGAESPTGSKGNEQNQHQKKNGFPDQMEVQLRLTGNRGRLLIAPDINPNP